MPDLAGGLARSDLILRFGQSAPSILGDFGRVGSIVGSFCPHDAVYCGFSVAREFNVYCHESFGPYDVDRLADATRLPPHCNPTQNVDRISRSNRVGLIVNKHSTDVAYSPPPPPPPLPLLPPPRDCMSNHTQDATCYDLARFLVRNDPGARYRPTACCRWWTQCSYRPRRSSACSSSTAFNVRHPPHSVPVLATSFNTRCDGARHAVQHVVCRSSPRHPPHCVFPPHL